MDGPSNLDVGRMRVLAVGVLPAVARAALAGTPAAWSRLGAEAQDRVCRDVKRHLSETLNGPAAQRLLRLALERRDALSANDLDDCLGSERLAALRRRALAAVDGQVKVRPAGEGGVRSETTGEIR